MTDRVFRAVILLALWYAVPGSAQSPAAGRVWSRDALLDSMERNPYADEARAVPPAFLRDLAELKALLGEPVKTDCGPVTRSTHAGPADKECYVTYRGIYLYYYYSAGQERYIRFLFLVHEPGAQLKGGIVIGMREEELIAILGPPSSRSHYESNDELHYASRSVTATSFGFSVKEGIVDAVSIWTQE
jgi:hypothetical protein